MVDESFDRAYQLARADMGKALGGGLKQLADAVTEPFAVLNRIEYSAPWALSKSKARCG